MMMIEDKERNRGWKVMIKLLEEESHIDVAFVIAVGAYAQKNI
jgi:hypothetical protein